MEMGLLDDPLWVIGRMKPLTELCGNNVSLSSNHDVVSSLRVGRHFYINLHRSILIERKSIKPLSSKYVSHCHLSCEYAFFPSI